MTVRTHVQGSAGTILLNRPEKRNALSRRLLADLIQAFGDMHQEKRVRAVILSGAGSAFCAGMDLSEMAERLQAPDAQAKHEEDASLYRELLDTMLHFPKPIIAAVGGPAVAGGAGLILASDIVVAGKSAKFGLPEPRRGIVAGLVAPLLAFRLGAGQAARLLLTSQTIDVDEGYRIGLFHERVEDEQIWARSAQLAEECAAGAPSSLQITKRMLNETIGEPLKMLLTIGAAVSAAARTTESADEGLQAFLQKRPPRWS